MNQALLNQSVGNGERKQGRVALYFRVSTEDQANQGTIETQAGEVRRYCLHHSLEIQGEYTDDGVSGTIAFDRREGGARLLADAAAGAFNTVLVYKLDRLGRDPLVTMLAVERLKELGVAVQSTTQSFDADDPTGRLLMTILSGVAGFERETIIQRSIAGTNRCAREGVWLGGIRPYGYRVEGQRATARLVEADEALPGQSFSPAAIIRLIYALAVEERLSCQRIADRLNGMEIPTPYVAAGRSLKKGRRPGATMGLWRQHQIRNILRSTTYKGVHVYGKASKTPRELIERPVPPLVSEALWEQAQHALRVNAYEWRAAAKRPRRQYLLRGLIRCAACGHSYCGGRGSRHALPYYQCSGQTNADKLVRRGQPRCKAKALRADEAEARIWEDIEGFLRDPGAVLAQLAEQMAGEAETARHSEADIQRLTSQLSAKQGEADTVIGLFRRGRISQAQLDRQLDALDREEAALRAQIESSRGRRQAAADTQAHLQSAEALLRELNSKADQPLTWELQREIVETLVKEICVETVGEGRKSEAIVHITYRFGSIVDRTERHPGSQPGRGCAAIGRCTSRRGQEYRTGMPYKPGNTGRRPAPSGPGTACGPRDARRRSSSRRATGRRK